MRVWSDTVGDGPALVLTHGWGATAEMWRPQLPVLAAHHRVARWDLPGHGRSNAPDDPDAYTHDAALAALTALVDETAVLGGHSLGGYLSLAFALRHPERVRGLVLLSTGPGYRDPEARE